MNRKLAFFTLLLITGCGTDGNEGTLVSVPLGETRLTGAYTLVDYLIEYGDGTRYDPSILKLAGTLAIGADSSYRESIRIGSVSSPTSGKIVQIKTANGKDEGELLLTRVSGDTTTSHPVSFSFRNDTLVLVTEVSAENPDPKKGFRETDYFLPDSLISVP